MMLFDLVFGDTFCILRCTPRRVVIVGAAGVVAGYAGADASGLVNERALTRVRSAINGIAELLEAPSPVTIGAIPVEATLSFLCYPRRSDPLK